MDFDIGDRVKIIELEGTEDGMGIRIGDTGIIVDVSNRGDLVLYVKLDNEIIEDDSNANYTGDNTYQFWDYQVEVIE